MTYVEYETVRPSAKAARRGFRAIVFIIPAASNNCADEIGENFDLKIAADEVVRKAKDPFALDLSGAADIVMLKVQPLGGLLRSHAIAVHHGLPTVVSSALESAVGITYGLSLAASLPELEFACGLATGALFSKDVAHLPINEGEISLNHPDIDLTGLDVAAERYEWWKNRVLETAEKIK